MSKHRTEEDEYQETRKKYPRVDFKGHLFFEICRDAYKSFKDNKRKLERLLEEQKQPRADNVALFLNIEECKEKINKHEAVAITFAGMCLEACIWDYAACKTSQNYTKNYLERLSFVARWVVIPELICDSNITDTTIDGTNLLGILRNLQKARNALVHSKSKPKPHTIDKYFKMLSVEGEIAAEDAFNLIKLLLVELEKVDNTNWWFFQTAYYRHSIK